MFGRNLLANLLDRFIKGQLFFFVKFLGLATLLRSRLLGNVHIRAANQVLESCVVQMCKRNVLLGLVPHFEPVDSGLGFDLVGIAGAQIVVATGGRLI